MVCAQALHVLHLEGFPGGAPGSQVHAGARVPVQCMERVVELVAGPPAAAVGTRLGRSICTDADPRLARRFQVLPFSCSG